MLKELWYDVGKVCMTSSREKGISVTVRNIVLVGFMGTGKSTVGRKLAERLGWSFCDSDTVLEEVQQTSIPELFRNHGEAHFRALETETLARILDSEGQVVATGGGAVLAATNRACMLQHGFVVALEATAATIIERVSADTNRPLLQGNLEERVHTLMEQRKHAYNFAHASIDTTELTEDEIVDLIIQHAGRH
ncbi:shikimate kinase [Paenibacillus qinlingensis]|uniref:Shikimate kinase n=1 Tax=Paenibacillus qinlingensis TaxID=1837343 RepID=A0ABU1NVH4_9BACL|nr:shikimate kinase [Paenibacillus qinlingensis]MDR6551470.1 shikimate kinase [Paenibacillus qinlingensis]